jgi:hypothetical protein
VADFSGDAPPRLGGGAAIFFGVEKLRSQHCGERSGRDASALGCRS